MEPVVGVAEVHTLLGEVIRGLGGCGCCNVSPSKMRPSPLKPNLPTAAPDKGRSSWSCTAQFLNQPDGHSGALSEALLSAVWQSQVDSFMGLQKANHQQKGGTVMRRHVLNLSAEQI